MNRKLTILYVIVSLLCFSCGKSNKRSDFVFPENDVIPLDQAEELSPEAISDIASNITSPVEIANLLLMMDVPFSTDFLASSLEANEKSTLFDKALSLGILGADLGYLNIYEMTGTSINILSSISKLASDLNVSQFFDFETIKRLSLNRNNLDSLLYLSVDSYTQIDEFLRDNGRGNLSSLIIIGMWLEGQYFATQVVGQYPNKQLRDRIGEQKIILNDLILLATPYKSVNVDYGILCGYLNDIKSAYDDVQITYTLGDPIREERNGGLVVTQTETSEVEMTDEQLDNIIKITKSVRDKLISND
ncbi:MAG: hypothetical protein J6T30_05525 [Bacteroidales bacterium]|nr:hypothetical protein [Bacteroidales bacterium]